MRRAARAALAAGLALAAPSCVAGDRSAAQPLPPPAATVAATLHDYRFELSGELPMGRVIVEVANRGTMNHALTLIEVPDDVASLDEQLRGGERRGVGTIARVPARPPGDGTRFAVDLRPGRYGLICLVADADGLTHGQKGMNLEFRVG